MPSQLNTKGQMLKQDFARWWRQYCRHSGAGREADVHTEARITALGEHTVAKFTTVKSITDTFPTSVGATDQQSKLTEIAAASTPSEIESISW